MNNSDISVHFLADVPEYGPIAMEWIYNTWGAGPGKTLADVIHRAHQYCNRTTLPIMFVATLGKKPVGCVILTKNDMRGWEHLSPWLASLYVTPESRGKGVAKELEAFLAKSAANLGYESIYLFTPDAHDLYEKLGWKKFKEAFYQGKDVCIMYKIPNQPDL